MCQLQISSKKSTKISRCKQNIPNNFPWTNLLFLFEICVLFLVLLGVGAFCMYRFTGSQSSPSKHINFQTISVTLKIHDSEEHIGWSAGLGWHEQNGCFQVHPAKMKVKMNLNDRHLALKGYVVFVKQWQVEVGFCPDILSYWTCKWSKSRWFV